MLRLIILGASILLLLGSGIVHAEAKDWVYVKPVNIERANVSFGSGITDNEVKRALRNRILMGLTLQVVTSEDGYRETEYVLGWHDESKQRFFPGPDSGEPYAYYCNDELIGSFEFLKSCLVQDWFRIERKYLLNDENRLAEGARFFSTKLPKRGKRMSGKAKGKEK